VRLYLLIGSILKRLVTLGLGWLGFGIMSDHKLVDARKFFFAKIIY
jgi:hypothetical protein